MSLSEKSTAMDAEVHDPLTSTVLDDMDSTENLISHGSSTNLLDSLTQPLDDSNSPMSHQQVDSDLLVEVSPYQDQQWVEEDVQLVDNDDVPGIQLATLTNQRL